MNKTDREHFIREQQAKIRPETATEAPLFTQAEFERYKQEALRIYKENPDLLSAANADSLNEAGYNFHKDVGVRIVKDAAADVVAYLSSERGQPDRCALLNVIHSKAQSMREYERIKDVVKRNALYQRPIYIPSENSKTDEYLQDRAQERRNGSRRPL